VSGLCARVAAVAAAGILITTTLASAALAGTSPRGGPDGTVSGLSSLSTIACPTARTCVATGQDQDGNGKSAIINAVSGSAKAWSGKLTDNDLNAIACPGKTTCLAVADEAVATVKVSTGAMKVTAKLKPPASGIVALGTLACAGSKNCYAAGFQGTETHSQAIVVRLSAAGKVLSKGTVAGTGIGAIACPSSSRCLVSDHFASGSEQLRLLTGGKLGAAHTFPAHTYVQHIACYQASLCYALGGLSTAPVTKTDELFPVNPKTGAIGKVVKLGSLSGTGLACVSARRCVVVGFTGSGAAAKPAVVVVSSGKAGHAAGEPGTYLSDVACATASLCYAVGGKGSSAIVDRV
jgi:hypothetical protein